MTRAFNPTQPYNALPALPPRADVESRPLLKACIEARVALAELRSASARLPAAMLLDNLTLLEAQASCALDHVVSDSEAPFRYAQLEALADDPAITAVLRCRRALADGPQPDPAMLDTDSAIALCSQISGAPIGIRRSGSALANAAGEVIYTAPAGESVLRRKLAECEHFVAGPSAIDPLIRVALAHYQFEAIHPFNDGGGRTGRVLSVRGLVALGLLDLPVLCLSSYLLRERADYRRHLLAVTTDSAWQDWVGFMLVAVTESARWTTAKLAALRQLRAAADAFVQLHAPRIHSRDLLDLLFAHPYCRIQNLVETGVAKRQTSSVYLKQLADTGMLRETQLGREKLFSQPNLIRLLTSDAHRVPSYGITGSV